MFSPAYVQARRGGPTDPRRFCAVNVAVRGPGEARWTFTEPREGGHATSRSLEVSGTSLRWEGSSLVIDINEQTTLLRRPVRGRVTLTPAFTTPAPVILDGKGRHAWWPVAPRARVEVSLDAPSLRFSGSGYHDSNCGTEPLEAGFDRWTWSRAEVPGGSVVLYDCERPEGRDRRGLLFRDTKQVEQIEAPREHDLGRGLWGMPRTTRSDRGGDARVVRSLHDSPFYTRALVSTRLAGHDVLAMHESLDLRRFVRPLVQWMIPWRMRRPGW